MPKSSIRPSYETWDKFWSIPNQFTLWVWEIFSLNHKLKCWCYEARWMSSKSWQQFLSLDQGFPNIFGLWTTWGHILCSVDPTVQQYAIKVTKRGPSKSPGVGNSCSRQYLTLVSDNFNDPAPNWWQFQDFLRIFVTLYSCFATWPNFTTWVKWSLNLFLVEINLFSCNFLRKENAQGKEKTR